MKVSEALEKGIVLVPERCENSYFGYGYDELQGRITSACVLGTIAVGRAGRANRNALHGSVLDLIFSSEFHEERLFVNPKTGAMEPLFNVLRHLNDDFHWTREECLLWLKEQGL